MKVLRARLATPLGAGGFAWLPDARVAVEGARIAEVRPWADGPAAEAEDVRSGILVPGLVDAHVHAPQTRIVGSATGPLLPWLERSVFPEESKSREDGWARGIAAEFARRTLAAGTTTTCVFSSSHARATDLLFEELDASGLRAFAGTVLMDQGCPDALAVPAARALAEARELHARWDGRDGGRLRFAITPRFALSCTRALLEGAGRLARDLGCLVQTHVSENRDEGSATLAAHPYAPDYLGVYEATGLLGRLTLLAHAIHLSPSEWDRLAAAGARVAHCPDSNFFLGSGRMPLDEARRRGVRVGLGSDVGAGRTFDIRRAAASAYDSALCLEPSVALAPRQLLRLATLGGAEALGLDEVAGSVEAGKEADLALFDLPEGVETEEQALSTLLFASERCPVRSLWVRGKKIL